VLKLLMLMLMLMLMLPAGFDYKEQDVAVQYGLSAIISFGQSKERIMDNNAAELNCN